MMIESFKLALKLDKNGIESNNINNKINIISILKNPKTAPITLFKNVNFSKLAK